MIERFCLGCRDPIPDLSTNQELRLCTQCWFELLKLDLKQKLGIKEDPPSLISALISLEPFYYSPECAWCDRYLGPRCQRSGGEITEKIRIDGKNKKVTVEDWELVVPEKITYEGGFFCDQVCLNNWREVSA